MTTLSLRFLLLAALFATTVSAHAADRFLMDFELLQGDKLIERGKAIVSQKQYTWNKGIQRSFLQLSCQRTASGKMEKVYTSVEYFTGVSVTHQLLGETIELAVLHRVVQPRLAEIRALSAEACEELSPRVTTTTQTYHLPAKDNGEASFGFGKDMTYRAKLQELGGTR
ncbi:MAG: hypothetical protein RRB22_11610 [Gammaproteobacteria bacterium]|nr:hypothetical protein [Gammaproteobacteria bacterium]